MDTLRTFIAIEIPADIRHRIKEHIDQLRAAFADVRASWTAEDNLHLTLKFLGDVAVARIPALSNAVAEATHTIDPFELIISGSGTFPPHGRPKVLWIGAHAGSAGILPASSSTGTADATSASSLSPLPLPLTSLHLALEGHCAAAGFEREPRAYHPHLTIARLRTQKVHAR